MMSHFPSINRPNPPLLAPLSDTALYCAIPYLDLLHRTARSCAAAAGHRGDLPHDQPLAAEPPLALRLNHPRAPAPVPAGGVGWVGSAAAAASAAAEGAAWAGWLGAWWAGKNAVCRMRGGAWARERPAPLSRTCLHRRPVAQPAAACLQGDAAAAAGDKGLIPAVRRQLAAAVVAGVSARYQQLAEDTLRWGGRDGWGGGASCSLPACLPAKPGSPHLRCGCVLSAPSSQFPHSLASFAACSHPLPRTPPRCSTVRKTESSLKRLKARQQQGEGSAAAGGAAAGAAASDTDKMIAQQLLLDVREFGRQAQQVRL